MTSLRGRKSTENHNFQTTDWTMHSGCCTSDAFLHKVTLPVHCSSGQPPLRLGHSGRHEGRSNRDSLAVSSARGHCEQFCRRQECPLFDVVHPAFSLLTTASPTLQGALKDRFGEAVVGCETRFDTPRRIRRKNKLEASAFFIYIYIFFPQ